MPVPPLPPEPWQVGDAVYSLRVVSATQRYRVHGVGRIVRIEGEMLHLETTKGPLTWGVTACPAFKTRADGEAYIAEYPGPGLGPDKDSRPMAHVGPSVPKR